MTRNGNNIGYRIASGCIGAGLVAAYVYAGADERAQDRRSQEVELAATAMAAVIIADYEQNPEAWSPSPAGIATVEKKVTTADGAIGRVIFTHRSVVGPKIGTEDVSQVYVSQYSPGQAGKAFSNEFGAGQVEQGWTSMASYSGSTLSFYYYGADVNSVSNDNFDALLQSGMQELTEVLDGRISAPEKPENLPY